MQAFQDEALDINADAGAAVARLYLHDRRSWGPLWEDKESVWATEDRHQQYALVRSTLRPPTGGKAMRQLALLPLAITSSTAGENSALSLPTLLIQPRTASISRPVTCPCATLMPMVSLKSGDSSIGFHDEWIVIWPGLGLRCRRSLARWLFQAFSIYSREYQHEIFQAERGNRAR